jgi:hypothetical protein
LTNHKKYDIFNKKHTRLDTFIMKTTIAQITDILAAKGYTISEASLDMSLPQYFIFTMFHEGSCHLLNHTQMQEPLVIGIVPSITAPDELMVHLKMTTAWGEFDWSFFNYSMQYGKAPYGQFEEFEKYFDHLIAMTIVKGSLAGLRHTL